MVEIDTLFMIETAENNTLITGATHTYILPLVYQGVSPPVVIKAA